MPYESQSQSLIDVQVRGKELEDQIKKLLGASGGRLPYDNDLSDIQADIILPNIKNPQIILSLTHTKPDTKGHSNENKFQLKIGELALWKTYKPKLSVILIVGGKKDEWLNYVLEAFPHFFDSCIYMWEKNDLKKFDHIKSFINHGAKLSLLGNNQDFWEKEMLLRNTINYDIVSPPNSHLRENFWRIIVKRNMGVKSPEKIDNEIFKRCMIQAYERYIVTNGNSGEEWKRLSIGHEDDYNRFWELRSFFNPSEAAVMMTLEQMGVAFLGDIAKDVTLPSMLHDLGMPMKKTKVSEDFVLWSEKYDKPIFIQCKSSGGGLDRHGKNIQNRAKEQVGRGLLYRCSIDKQKKKLISKGKWFIWVALVDGNWGVTKKHPLKYVNMLKIAGYDKILPADCLIDNECNLKFENTLSQYLNDLSPIKSFEELKMKCGENSIGVEKSYAHQSKKMMKTLDTF